MMGGKEGGGEDEERRVRREGPNQTLNFVSRAWQVCGTLYFLLRLFFSFMNFRLKA